MNFIETLKSVGGVRPCRDCAQTGTQAVISSYEEPAKVCLKCRGTGRIIDLSPLLAKPKELSEVVRRLLLENDRSPLALSISHVLTAEVLKNLCVIGPQRAHSLVYECVRQLGGTAVVAEHKYVSDVAAVVAEEPNCDWPPAALYDGYRLSLPIPPDATVLFVTDTADEQEIRAISRVTGVSVTKVLPYLLALVHRGHAEELFTAECTFGTAIGSVSLRVISLHQEKP